MRRLLRPAEAPPDVRPAMLSVWVALLLLLIPSLLLTTSEQKLVGLEIGLLGAGTAPPSTGSVERVAIKLASGRITIDADVRKTDVGATAGEVVRRTVDVPPRGGEPDWTEMQATLAGLKAIDPGLDRAIVDPDPSLTTQQVVAFFDAVRSRDGVALLPNVVLEAPQ